MPIFKRDPTRPATPAETPAATPSSADNDAATAADTALALAAARFSAGDMAGTAAALATAFPAAEGRQRLLEHFLGERHNAQAIALIASAAFPVTAPQRLIDTAIRSQLAGDLAQAIEHCRRALALDPDDARACNHLGRALHNAGRPGDARQAFERAVALDPGYAQAWHNLGHVLRAEDRLAEACARFEHALAISPHFRLARLNLGITRIAMDQPDAALACFDRLLARNPADVEALVNAGLALHMLGRTGEARIRYETALQFDPMHQPGHYYLGALCNELSDAPAAIAALRRALQLQPADADAWAELAAVYELSSETTLAAEAVRSGLAVAPQHPQLTIEAAKLARRQGQVDAAHARLQRLDASHLPTRIRQQYLYELGTVLDRLQRPVPAYAAFCEANAVAAHSIRRRDIDPHAIFRKIAALQAWIGQRELAADSTPPAADPDTDSGTDLCFLVGFPRSGTTLLDTILDAHPDVHSIEERPTFERVIDLLEKLPDGYPASIDRLTQGDRVALRRVYRQALQQERPHPAGTLVLDKLPLRSLHVGAIHTLFPDARFIFSKRHPCDVVLSNFMQQYTPNEAFVHFYTLADTVRIYDATLSLWETYQRRLALRLAYVGYEDLVANPEREMAAICRFIGIQWNPAMLDTQQRTQARGRIRTNSYQQVAEPIYTRAVQRWQRYRQPLAAHLPVLRAHAEYLGYTLDAGDPP